MSAGVTNENRDQIVQEAVQAISHIATLPEITLKIIELVESPNSTAHDLHKIISNDPALCSRILKVVNSAFYGLPGQIGSINRAIVLLGLNAVKNIAVAASLSKLYRGGELCDNFAARDLWMHSISAAASAKLVADTIRLGLPDEAFLSGLIHDIGVMVELQHNRHQLIEVVERLHISPEGVPEGDMCEIETEVFGANHTDFGKALCEKWKFPKSFAFVTSAHHNPMGLPTEHRTLASVVYVADRLAGKVENGYRLDLPDLQIDPAVLDELKLTDSQLRKICEQLPACIEDVEQTLS